MRTSLTDNEVKSLTWKLNDAFGTSASVRLTNGVGARAIFSNNEFTYGRNGDNRHFPNGDPTVIHEFAHILDYSRRTFDRKNPHGINFYRALIDSIKASGCYDPKDHPWHLEYHVLYTFAVRDGLTSRSYRDRAEDDPEVIRNDRSTLPYKAVCPNGHVAYRSRAMRPGRSVSCSKCSRKYDPRFILNYKRVA